MRVFPVRIALGSALAATLALAACQKSSPPTGNTDPVPTSLSISPNGATIVSLGVVVQLTATVLDQNGQAIGGASVTWASGTEGVATVSASGQVTGVSNGTASITATSGSLSASVTVTVQQVPASMAAVSGDGQTAGVTATLPAAFVGQVNDGNQNGIEGVAVTIAVTTGGGSLSATSATTGTNGQFSTTATLGSITGSQTFTASVVGNTAVNRGFTATAEPGPATTLAMVSGNNQSAFVNAQLPGPIVVSARDAFGNGVPGASVTFSVLSGGGLVTPTDATTDASGAAAAAWTLGPNLGPNTAQAAAAGLTGSPVMFTALASQLGLTSVSPDPVVEGASATLTGTGFNPIPANNTVRVDGIVATVTLASTTSLTITVPTSDCRPGRQVDFTVSVGAGTSNAVAQTVRPTSFVALGVGQQQILRNPTDLCLQFDANNTSEEYLIGIQSTSETVSQLSPFTLSGEAPPLTPAPPAAMLTPPTDFAGAIDVFNSPRFRRMDAHRGAEADIQATSRSLHERLRNARMAAGATTASAFAVPSTLNVGDTITINVWDRNGPSGGTSCDDRAQILTTVRAKGTSGFWLSDNANAANGYTDTDFQNLSDQFDADIYQTDVDHLGAPTDGDANGRVVVVITKEVNRVPNLLGFVISCDLFPNAQAAASNEGEFFYGKAPDLAYDVADAREDAPFVIAHELAHVIQQSRRDANGNAFLEAWLAEGQATLAEEIVGFEIESRTTGQNYDFDVAFNINDPNGAIDWYSNGFVDLYRYFGFESSGVSTPQAPHECSWLANPGPGPCSGGRKVYGVPWSLLRYISDRFGPVTVGGEATIHKALIDNSGNGFALLSSAVSQPIEDLLAKWAAALYVDGRVPSAAADITITSWNITDVFEGSAANGSTIPVNARLIPEARTFGAFSTNKNVRAASTYYSRLSGARSALAVKARQQGGGTLPSNIQMWLVRIN